MAESKEEAKEEIIFRQFFDRTSCTYTYLLACPKSKECLLIDPVMELADRDLQFVKEMGLSLKYVVNTHCHADHITGSGVIKKEKLPDAGIKSVIGGYKDVTADLHLKEGDELKCGGITLKVLETPGHTEYCVSYVYNNKMVFTGDALFVRGCGRTDFQGGSSANLYDSVHKKIFALPDDCTVYPGHDYGGRLCSTVGEEKKYNPRLGGGKTKEQFEDIMKNLNLSNPGKMHFAVPANRCCGYPEDVQRIMADVEKSKK
eukprot:CAMPEP_0197026092 /NCGR_PEP_ID=MMETSP1384-20130603/6267_1 /TAXON_ID=29189 /ORGANISM="Ammonia sp." /LENGTH=258 /DNA_ID=CAMNT_0042454701 /DNA_START=61 /DNA_END=837 /DNA_ORIENTATION=+